MNEIKVFEQHDNYSEYITSTQRILSNVSYCEDKKELHYTPWKGVVATFDITTNTQPTRIAYNTTNIIDIRIDCERQPNIPTTKQFDTKGTHILTYTLNNNKTITENMFRSCESVKTVKLSDTITSIGDYAFYSNYALTKIEMPDTVTSWGSFCFQVCKKITSIGPHGSGASIEIPSKLTTLPQLCFGGCTALADVVIPSTIRNFSPRVFEGCTALNGITILATNPPHIDIGAGTTIPTIFGQNGEKKNIYVPAESVNTYKNNTTNNWAYYADYIFPIQS